MNSILLEILYCLIGGFIFTTFSLIIFQFSSFHPYSKPTIPVLVQIISITVCALIVMTLNNDLETIGQSIRFSMVEGIIGILVVIPFLYIFLIYFLLRASFRKRNFDQLLDASE